MKGKQTTTDKRLENINITAKWYLTTPPYLLFIKNKITGTYQKDFLKATEQLSHHFPHLRDQFENSKRSEAAEYH